MSISTLISIVDQVVKIAGKVKVENKIDVNTNSIIEFSSVSRFEPRTLVDSSLDNTEELVNTLQSVNTLFAAYLMQAIAVNNIVGDIHIIKHLDKFNPNRQNVETKYDFKGVLSKESYETDAPNLNPALYRYGLPSMEALDNSVNLSNESFKEEMAGAAIDKVLTPEQRKLKDKAGNIKDAVERLTTGDPAPGPAGGSSVDNRMIKEVLAPDFDLSVGKMFAVTINSGDQSAAIPLSVRLMVQRASPKAMTDILKYGSNVEGVEDRWDRFKMGELQFWRDIVFCQDLIDEQCKALSRDKTGHLQDIMKRTEINKRAAKKTGTPSVGTASSIYIISSDTAKMAERELMGKLDNPKVRQKLFENTYSMILVVMDAQWRRVTIYHRGINQPTNLTFNELKASARKGGGTDVMEILRAFKSSEAPSFR